MNTFGNRSINFSLFIMQSVL